MRALRTIAFAAAAVLFTAGAAAAQTIGAANWPTEQPPRPLPASRLAFPPYELKTLSNGLQVLVIPHHEPPSVSMRLIIKAGAAQDPADKPGVAQMVATLLDQGTSTKSSEDIANLVESSGGLIGTGAGNELSFVNSGVIKDRFNELMALMAEMVEQPAFSQGELDRQKSQAMSGMQVRYEDPDFVADVVYDRLIYGFHPYGRPPGGTPDSLAKLTRNDLVAFHRTWFVPNNALLAIVGDLSSEEMFAGAEKAFGSWARKDVPAQTQADPPPPTRRVVVIDKPGAVQTEIRAGHLTLPRTSPDWLNLELLIRVLGGEGANRLFNELRTDRGLTYGASADLQTFKFAGGFVASTNTRTEATGEALRVLVDQMWRLQREPVRQGELRGVKDYYSGSFPLTVETPGAIALQVLNQIFYGLDLKELEQLRERVDAVSVQDLQATAKKWLFPDRLSIVLVGDASKFVDQLKAQGFDNFERIPIGELDLTSPTLRKGGKSGPAPETAATAAPASANALDLVKKIADAKGGLAALRAVSSVDVSASVTISGQGAPVKMTTRNLVQYPGKFRVEADTPSGKLVQVFTDAQAWMETPAGTIDADAEARADYKASAARDLIPLLIAASDGKVGVTELPAETVNGAPAVALRFAIAAGGPLVLVADAKTFQVRELRYPTEPAPDAPQAVERFDDYRDVNGVRVAFHARVEREGVSIERTLSSVRFNVPLAASLFVKKPA
jgi:zinc protease